MHLVTRFHQQDLSSLDPFHLDLPLLEILEIQRVELELVLLRHASRAGAERSVVNWGSSIKPMVKLSAASGTKQAKSVGLEWGTEHVPGGGGGGAGLVQCSAINALSVPARGSGLGLPVPYPSLGPSRRWPQMPDMSMSSVSRCLHQYEVQGSLHNWVIRLTMHLIG